jgi:hypothetical protein
MQLTDNKSLPLQRTHIRFESLGDSIGRNNGGIHRQIVAMHRFSLLMDRGEFMCDRVEEAIIDKKKLNHDHGK